jgi:molybdopterin synthase catalytic subunit
VIRVQAEDFDVGDELARLAGAAHGDGALSVFVGSVRAMSEGRAVAAMTLEHYPGMTERALAHIEAEARARWPLGETLVIHRHGRLRAGERIVLVAVTAAHRAAACDACRFLIDWLKTKAPFWKAEETDAGRRWVEAHADDEAAATRWNLRETRRGEGR